MGKKSNTDDDPSYFPLIFSAFSLMLNIMIYRFILDEIAYETINERLEQ